MVHLDSGLAETIDYLNKLLHRAYYALEPLTDGTIQFDVKLSDHEMLDIPDRLECLRWRVKKTPVNEIERIITECSDAVSVIDAFSKNSSQPDINEIRKAREMFQRIGSALLRILLVESGQKPVSTTEGRVGTDGVKKRRGRKRIYSPKDDKKLSNDWKRARDSGISKVDFCEDNSMTIDNLDRCLARVRKAKSG